MGRIPPWVQGNFYRNGPGKFEFGEDQYAHFFDPLAIAQKFQFTFDANKKRTIVRYNSKFIQTRNFRENEKASRIVYPEVGTWAEDDLVQFYPNGSQIEDEQQVAEKSQSCVEPADRQNGLNCDDRACYSSRPSTRSAAKRSELAHSTSRKMQNVSFAIVKF